MIGFNELGSNGRLGNQMFQLAALIGIAEEKGLDYTIPDHSNYSDFGGYRHHELQVCFDFDSYAGNFGLINGNIYEATRFDYDRDYIINCPDNVSLSGYFQSEKYFSHVENTIRSLFKFPPDIIDRCVQRYPQILTEPIVGVHVRRGDYLLPIHLNRHPVCSEDYYKRAMRLFKGRSFLVVSDDVAWCKQQEVFSDGNVSFVDNPLGIYKGHFDLCVLSLCSDFIIANSSFSWWGAWLSSNREKKVVSPLSWFGEELAHLPTKDIVPPNWLRI